MARHWKIAALCAALAALAILYYIFNPLTTEWAPKCSFKLLTGWDCPGCGSQRVIHALLHGDFIQAWHANPFLICLAPFLLLLAFAALYRKRWPRLYAAVNSVPVIVAVMILIVAWTVARNLLF